MKRPSKVALKFLITAAICVFEGDNSAQSIMGRHTHHPFAQHFACFPVVVVVLFHFCFLCFFVNINNINNINFIYYISQQYIRHQVSIRKWSQSCHLI
jgi:hypothetical protein